jgi:ubiquinone/menaquinone biosynthesis C-methylase UbiE
MSNYSLGSDEREQQRLASQADLLEPITERFLRAAGLEPGMRVLDVGCGVGDVAMLAARILEGEGQVLAVDRDPAMVQTARLRVKQSGLPVEVVQRDLTGLALDQPPFDAAIGRLILMHVSDPVLALRAAAAHVRPGGIVAFQDYTTTEARSYPPLPKAQLAWERIVQTFERLGADPQGGDKLRGLYLAAGLPEPELRVEALLGGSRDDPIFDMVAGATRALLPAMERVGVVAPGEVDPDRLRDELRDEVAEAGGIMFGPPMVGAWTRIS